VNARKDSSKGLTTRLPAFWGNGDLFANCRVDSNEKDGCLFEVQADGNTFAFGCDAADGSLYLSSDTLCGLLAGEITADDARKEAKTVEAQKDELESLREQLEEAKGEIARLRKEAALVPACSDNPDHPPTS